MKNKKVIYIYWKLWCYYIIQILKKEIFTKINIIFQVDLFLIINCVIAYYMLRNNNINNFV